MRKIKKVLGLVLAVTICVLGLASCKSGTTVKVRVSTTPEKTEQVSGDLYLQTTWDFKEPEGTGTYLLLGSDGYTYTSKWSLLEDGKYDYIFTKANEWSKIDEDIICIASYYYLKTEKYIVEWNSSSSRLYSKYIKVDGLKYADK